MRHLLIKGANRTTKDNQGRTALDFVIEEEFKNVHIQNELRSYLKDDSSFQCVMIKTPLKKLTRNNKTVILYLILIFISFLILDIYSVSDLPMQDGLKYGAHIFLAISILSFLFCWLKDPGFVKPDPKIDFLSLLECFDPNALCPECEVIRTSRSRHCNICNRCVNRFDHHCPWINNCVGGGNHGWFYLYILSTLLYAGCLMFLSGQTLYTLMVITLTDEDEKLITNIDE